MSRKEFLEKTLSIALSPSVLEVINESQQHMVPSNSESHFKLIIVTDKFTNLNRIERHRLIFSILADEFKNMHALTLSLYTPKEWEDKKNNPEISPKCAHKHK